jgi:hypothetical protein
VDQVHPGVGARQEVVGHETRERQHVGERGPVTVALERGGHGHTCASHRDVALAADRHDLELAGALGDGACRVAHGVGVERSREAPVGGEQDDEAGAGLLPREQRVLLGGEHGCDVREDLVQLLLVGPRLERRVLGALELGRGHELHRARDLLDVLDRADAASDLALAGHERVGASSV